MKRRATLLAGVMGLFASAAFAGNDGEATSSEPTLLDQAAAPYILLRADIDSITSGGIKNADSIREAHNKLASHDPEALGSAFVAYAALVAADSPKFAAAIEERTKRAKNREKFLQELRDNPAMVRDLDGADEAINVIMAMTARDATKIGSLGELFIQQAYALQEQGWARKKLPDNGMTRVRGAENWAASRAWPAMDSRTAVQSKAGTYRPNLDADEMWTDTWSSSSAVAKPDAKSGATMTRALVLAARYATDDLNEGQLKGFAVSKTQSKCFVSAKLNFNQCIAATRTPYEEAFCIGTHGLNDVSRCVGWPASAGTAN